MKKILFITWDGPQTNYLESLFLPIFERLQIEYSYEFHVVQLTWGDNSRIEERIKTCQTRNIKYQPIFITSRNRLFAFIWAYFFQSKRILNYIKRNKIDIVIPRATTSAALVNGIHRSGKFCYVFDSDGFSQDERVENAGWKKNGLRYILYRKFEKRALELSKSVICRTFKAKSILLERANGLKNSSEIFVMRNGVNSEFFIPRENQTNLADKECVNFIYVGSIGPQYRLFEMLNIFSNALKEWPKSKFMILTGDTNHTVNFIETHFLNIKSSIHVKRAAPNVVVSHIRKSDIAFSLRSPSFAMKAVSPIKVGEYLLCGIPIITNTGIGDMDEILGNKECAFLINNLEDIPFDAINNWIEKTARNPEVKYESRNIGLNYFSLEKSVKTYHEVIEQF